MPASAVTAAACFIIGDCIATQPHGLGGWFPSCRVSAKVGLSANMIVAHVPATKVKWLVISAGTNDTTNLHLMDDLRAIRSRAKADVVVWIVPVPAKAAAAVRSVAEENGDRTVGFVPGVGGRQASVHPKSYAFLSRGIRSVVASISGVRSVVR
jgi:thiamine biosynthesis protein ThiC